MTASAVGIQIHPIYKLGVIPRDKSLPMVAMSWLRGAVPAHPRKANHFPNWSPSMYGNDQFGVCGPAMLGNFIRMVTKYLTGTEIDVTQDDVYDLYRRSGNPGFNPSTGADDNGVDNAVMFQAFQAGGLGGRKPVCYAKLVDDSDASLAAGIDVFGGLCVAVDLQVSQQKQTDAANPYWDYSRSPEWGGHDIPVCSYDEDTGDMGVSSWTKQVRTTAAFRRNQLSEAYVPILPEHVNSGVLFDSGLNMAEFVADYEQLTGTHFPIVIPPQPPTPPVPPVPPVPPTPPPVSPVDQLRIDLAAAMKLHGKARQDAIRAAWQKYLAASKGGQP